jgi:hypothetical protein
MTTFAKSKKPIRRRICYTPKIYEEIKASSAREFRPIEDETMVLIARGLAYSNEHRGDSNIQKYL